ncbi:hypothetical protein [Halorhabdus rudnickae]|uniref:hypothetical protein n=1 Tax=Halorhabdus rudnickae TaxID=1775544 RepID=UPI001083D9F3|nr:hypothetical protein [Halorhabdus rudnickae]
MVVSNPTRTVYFDDAVTHVVTPAHGPRAARVSDFEDVGFDVVGIGLLPSAIGGCDYDDPGGRHLLLRRSNRPD